MADKFLKLMGLDSKKSRSDLGSVKYTTEVELEDFDFWSGARDVAERINEQDNSSDCWSYLEDIVNEMQNLGDTTINDFVWFDAWDMLEEAGLIHEDDEDDDDEDEDWIF